MTAGSGPGAAPGAGDPSAAGPGPRQQLGRRALSLLLGNWGASGLNLLAGILVARRLGPDAVGALSFTVGLSGVIMAALVPGFLQAHMKRIAEGQDVRACLGTFIAIKLALFSVLALAFAIGSEWTARLFETPALQTVFLFMFAGMIASSFADVFTTALVARERAVERGIVLVAARVVRFLAIVLVLVTVADVRWVAAAYALEGVVELGAGVFFVWRALGVGPGLPTRHSVVGYWQYARPLLVIGPVGMIQDSVDRVAVTQWAGLTAAGYYHVARGIWEMFSSILAPSTMLLFARLSAIFSDRTAARDAEARTLFYSGAEKLLFVTVPAGYVVWVVAGPLLGLVFGPDFVHAEGAVRIFVVATLVATVVNPYVQAIYALDVVARFLPVILLRFALYLALLAVLIPVTPLAGPPTLGLADEGGALARLFAVAFPAWVYVRWTRELIDLGFYRPTWGYLGSFSVALAVFEVALWMPLPDPLVRVVAAALGLAAYAATLVALHPRSLKTFKYCRSLLSPVDFWHFFRREIGRP